jgi:hypothetical protein
VATSAQVEAFRTNSAALVTLVHRDLEDFWSALNTDGNPLLVRAAFEDFFPELVNAYGDAAALLGADFYDELRDVPPSAKRFTAALAPPPDVAQSLAVTRWGLGPLFQPEPDPAQALLDLAGAAQRLVLQSSRDSIFNAARKDPVRTGFARVPRGAKTCPFCTMIASRGAVFSTAASAGESNRWHNDCDCAIVPMRGKSDYPEGYDPERFLDAYAAGVGIGTG